jgi:small-conductance mechanosensitive channel
MVYVIPSQTLFQERVPDNLMGRVVALRSTLVFGAMTLAMAVGGYVAEAQGVEATLVVFGVVAALAGVGGLLVPAVRRA